MKFRDLAIGQSFDFIDDSHPTWNSFYERCAKTGTRTYRSESGTDHRVGSINAAVFHVEPVQ